MNIFVLDDNPVLAAQMACDRHVVKMVLETAQILSTVVNSKLPQAGLDLYQSTHAHHPCTLWAGASYSNFSWLLSHGYALGAEYTYRYFKKHKSVHIFNLITSITNRSDFISSFSTYDRTPFALAMPQDCKEESAVQSYRNYYKKYRGDIATWSRRRPAPDWY